MKRTIARINIVMILSCFYVTSTNGQDVFRLLDPINGGRYGKAASDGQPFYKFGTIQEYYHTADSRYDNHSNAISNLFSNWNNAGPVNFSSTPSSGLPLETYYSSYGFPGIVNPGVAYTADDNYVINTDNSYVRLNTFHTWGTIQRVFLG